MAPTILVSEETRDRLARYKADIGVETDEEAILLLLRLTEAESAFGSMAGWGSWTDEGRFEFRSDDGGP